ncbi:MAG: homoserine dehydrogenase [Alphaproteobacteria bacterium]
MTEPLRIAVAGLGTVGAGTLKLLANQSELLAQRCGRPLHITAVSARDRDRDRGLDLSGMVWFADAVAMAREAEADVVVELIGGEDGIARAVCQAAIESGRHVVTANKAMLAHHGTALARLAEEARVSLHFEAAVAGGIPIVKSLREGLAGNRVRRVYGILNGTCNYILTVMRETGRDFAEVLAEAQELGYAEADPGMDVDGVDSAHKLALLASLAFGCEVDLPSVYVEGIRHLSPQDIEYAGELGYRIKLLGSARLTGHGLEQRVHPCMVDEAAPIAHVDGVYNAIVATGDFVEDTGYEGRGAGAGPTASAVVADLADIARGRTTPTFSVPAAQLVQLPPSPMTRHEGPYYIRLTVIDRPGVIADVSAAFRDEQVSIESMLQRGRSPSEAVPVVLTTHTTQEGRMQRALAQIAHLDSVVEPPCMIRIEDL